MASIFKRLFSSGGAQAATAQMEEPAEVSATEKLLAEEGLGASPGEQPPSEEELKEFLIRNFLEDSAAGIEPPQAASIHAANTAAEHTDSSREPNAFVARNSAVAGEDRPRNVEVEATSKSLADIYRLRSGAVLAQSASEIQDDFLVQDASHVAAPILNQAVAKGLPPTLTEIPEVLPPTLTDALAESTREDFNDDSVVIPSLHPAEGSAESARIDSGEWALEEALANHKQWLDSRGAAGRKAALREGKLEGMELISANLRYADLQDANLRAADLLLADLRDACLVRANLQDSCLVGANLEGANLEGASLESAMGLVPRQLAGTNLREASLPAQIAEFAALEEFAKASKTSARTFSVVILASLVSCLMIWKTKDVQLVTDSAILPFLHSPAASAALPTAEIYLIAPVLLLCVYLFFQYHLQRLWDSVLELPAVFPDGRVLGEKQSRIVTGLMRLHFHWMNQDAPSTRLIEKSASALLAYWIVPIVLVLFWGRYLTLQEIHGTILHEALVMAAVGVAIYAT